jgi:hypothetical protein
MTDCTNLAVGDRVCINNSTGGTVVKAFSKYVAVKAVYNTLLDHQYERNYSRRDGTEWGGGSGYWNRNFIEPWNEEKHAPAVAQQDLIAARRNIAGHVSKRADRLSLGQINEIKAILLKAEGKE